MNSHFQSSETTCTSSGGTSEDRGVAGSSSWEPIQATPPSKVMTSSGTDQTISSRRPEYSQSGRYLALVLDDRNHHANAIVAAMVGTTIASMMATESIRMVLSAIP